MNEFYGTEDDAVMPTVVKMEEDESCVLLSAVKYQLSRRSYNSVLITSYIRKNIDRISFEDAELLISTIKNSINSKEVSPVDILEWNVILHILTNREK